jgi:hypothetical protein
MVPSKPTSFRFRPDVLALLARLCERERRSATNMVEVALVEYAKQQGVSVLSSDEAQQK